MIILKLVLILLLSGTSTEVYVSHKLESSINIFSTRLVHFTSIPTDMIILFDESMSTTIKKDYFTAELNFAEMIARMFRVSPNDTRMAIISFASRTSIHLNFISSDKGNMCNFLHSLNKIDAQGGWTFTADALKKAEELFSDSHNRPNSQKLILLITDGKSNGENPIPVAKKLKAKGVNIFAVGIGATVEEELKEIVSSAAHLLLLENFTRLDKITETLKKDIVNNYYLMEDSMKQCLSNCLDRGECCDKNAVCSCGRDGIYSCTCRKGFYGTGNIGNCLKCPRGSFSSELGQEKCHLCPLHSDTLREGAMSIHECHCNLGYSGSRSIIGFCKPQQCPKLIPPEGGSLLPSRCGNSLHDECSFFCSSPLCPYNGSIVGCIKQSSRKEQDNSRCLISGQWTIPKFKCEMAKCPQLKDVKNGYYSCDDFSSKIGTKCNLNCHIGFEIAGGTGLAVCLQNGSWQKDDSYCKKIFCRKLELSHELTLKPPNCSHYDQPYLAECEYSCKPGYALVTSTIKLGNSTSVIKGKCGVTGQWIVSHDYFRCLELHDCKNKQCENGGSCEITVDNSSFCNCLPGFTGISCEKSINSECEENFCLNNGSCKDNSICICQPGFSGVICEININDCSPDSCINGGTCQDGINSYHCLCPEGIQGKSCEIVPNLCISEPCQNNGRCRNKFKTFHCCCAAGFTGSVCDINVDDCASRPCFNGGVCQDGINNYTCSCPSGFFGPNCENIINNCLSSPCKNGGTCKNLILAMKCFCLPGFTGNLCEIELSRKFDLIFPGKSTSDYVFLRYKEHLNALTVAFWMQTNMKNKIRGTPVSLSYITPDSKIEVTNAFTIYDVTNIILFLHGLELHTNICANSDELWHHYAITWDSFDGTWATYVDGKRWAGGSGAAVGHVFWSGTFVLGQEQDLIEGGFTLAETFEGKLSQFNVWNFILSHEAIQQLSQSCGYSGNVIAWAEVKNYTRGNVKATFNAEICEHIGYFRNGGLEENNTKVNFCSDKNHGNLNLNKSLKECEQNNYNCHNGFTDPFCKYDINECFFDNGNCSHSCLNLHGSYKCLCPPGFFLSHDQRNCETTRYCFHEGLFYMDDEEWEQNCQTCRCKNGRVKCSAIVCSNHNCSREELSVLLPHQCCKQCIQLGSKCTVNHKNIYLTFDDATFKFVAACRHILAQDCSKGTVSIFIENEDASSERKNLIVESDCLTIEVFSTGRLLINDRESVYPFYLSNQINIYPSRYSYHFNDYKTIKFKHSSASSYMLVTKEEVIISWNSLGVVEIFVPDKMKRQMCGLCGNMNGDSSDDFLTNSLMTSSSILEFTSSWQVDSGNCKILERNPKGTPSQARADGVCKSSWQKLRAKKLCQELRSEHFHKCYQVVNSQGFYDLCVQDVCSCNRTDRCQCNAINAYVVECAKFNVSPDSKWKERDDCVTCQDQMVFDQCGPPCPKTCEKDIKDVRCQISSCKIGCRCPLHLALHDGKCIHPADCPLDYQINKTV